MRTRLPAMLAAAGLLGLLAASPAGAVVVDERALAPGQVFHLRIEAGEVQVAPAAAGAIGVEADLAPGQALRWRDAPGRLVLVVDDSERLVARPATLRLAIPADADLVLRLGDASLRMDGVGGERLVIHGGAGEVRLASDARRLRVDTGSGNIDIRHPGGRLVTRSLQGAQRIALAGPGDVEASTVGGDVDLVAAGGGRLRLASVTGRIALRPSTSAGLDARLETLSGVLDVRWPAGQGFVLALAQARGETQLPGGMVQRADGAFVAGDGAGRLSLTSYSGPIAVRILPDASAPAPGP